MQISSTRNMNGNNFLPTDHGDQDFLLYASGQAWSSKLYICTVYIVETRKKLRYLKCLAIHKLSTCLYPSCYLSPCANPRMVQALPSIGVKMETKACTLADSCATGNYQFVNIAFLSSFGNAEPSRPLWPRSQYFALD